MQTWQLQWAHKFAAPLDGRSGQILKSNKNVVVFSFQINFMVHWSQLWRRAGGARGGPAPVAMELCQGERSHTPKGLTLASECGAIQRHILLWGKVRNWRVSAGSWVIGTCYYCVPPPPFNNLFIEITLLQISLHSHKARFFKKYMHSYSCQVWIPTSFIFHKEKGWFLWYPGIFPHCWSESGLPVRRRAVSLPYLAGDVILPLIQNLAGS